MSSLDSSIYTVFRYVALASLGGMGMDMTCFVGTSYIKLLPSARRVVNDRY